MDLTKLGHSCLLVEEAGVRILIDPGTLSTGLDELDGIDAVLYTHAHADHFDPETLARLSDRNGPARIVADGDTAEQVRELGREVTVASDGDVLDLGVEVRVVGSRHAVIHLDLPGLANVGYLVSGRLFHPGDALTLPPVDVEVLALPVVAPWTRVSECVDYLRAVAPARAVPIHDAIAANPAMYHRYYAALGPEGTVVDVLPDGQPRSLQRRS